MAHCFGAQSFQEEKRAILELCTPEDDLVEVQARGVELFQHELQRFAREDAAAAAAELRDQLPQASEEALRDREIALAVVTFEGALLEHFDPALKDDPEVVVEAVREDGAALEHASERLRSCKDFMLRVVRISSRALQWSSEALKADREVLFAAATKNVAMMRFASETLKADPEFILSLVKRNGSAAEYASKKLLEDRPFVLEAAKCNGQVLAYVSKEFRADRDIVEAAMGSAGLALQHASVELRGDKDMVLRAVGQFAKAVKFASRQLQQDKDFMLLAARRCRDGREVMRLFREAHLQNVVGWGAFSGACESAVAVPGQEAPLVSIVLSCGEKEGRAKSFLCEASLLSGASFSCEVHDDEVASADCTRAGARPGPTVQGLASKLVEALPSLSEVAGIKHIFIALATDLSPDGESSYVSVWDWNRPLKDFFCP